jgi:hypothetical protein
MTRLGTFHIVSRLLQVPCVQSTFIHCCIAYSTFDAGNQQELRRHRLEYSTYLTPYELRSYLGRAFVLCCEPRPTAALITFRPPFLHLALSSNFFLAYGKKKNSTNPTTTERRGSSTHSRLKTLTPTSTSIKARSIAPQPRSTVFTLPRWSC